MCTWHVTSRHSIRPDLSCHLACPAIGVFFVIRSRTGRTDYAWVGMALLLSAHTLFNAAGGIYDYRIDFSAFCLYGIFACLMVWSGSFRHTSRILW
jgi:hypothetical protein